MRQVRLRTKAHSDLVAIDLYTRRQWGEEKALEVEQIFKHSFTLINDAPYLGRTTRQEHVLVKTIPAIPFVIVYKVTSDSIFILRVIHSKRNR
jgi:toxin ParE1/3/4